MVANGQCKEFNFMDLREEILKILNSEVSELKEGSDGDYQQVKAIDECDFNDVSERLIKLFSLHRVSISSPLHKLHNWCEHEGYKEGVELLVRGDNMKPIIVDCNSKTSVNEFKDHIDEC